MVLVAVGGLTLACAVFVGGIFVGDIHGTSSMRIQRVTPREIASAMAGDRFYSDYRQSTLIVTGTLQSVGMRAGRRVLAFRTGSAFGALCDLGAAQTNDRAGDVVTVAAEGARATRSPTAVVLVGCTEP